MSKPAECIVKLGRFSVDGKKVVVDFTFDVNDKNVRALTKMRKFHIGLREPDMGQPKPRKHDYSANKMGFAVEPKGGKGKLKFDDNKLVIDGLRHVHDCDNQQVILFQTDMEIEELEEKEEDDDGQGELPEE